MADTQPPIELVAPDIRALCSGNTDIEYVTSVESGVPGPHVVINALCHGNELCVVVAVERLLRLDIRPLRGRLTLCLANVAAFRRFNPARPHASRYVVEDFNRVWSREVLEGRRDSVELRRARELRPLYQQADVLLDLHSMVNPGEPLALCGRTLRGRALALALGYPRWVIVDAGHASGRRLIDFDAFACPDDEAGSGGKVALLVECGQHWATKAAETAFALSLRTLAHTGLISPSLVHAHAPALGSAPQRVVEVTEVVTATSDDFSFVADFVGMEAVPRAGTVIGYDHGQPVRTPYDDCILIMPSRKTLRGQTAVRLARPIAV